MPNAPVELRYNSTLLAAPLILTNPGKHYLSDLFLFSSSDANNGRVTKSSLFFVMGSHVVNYVLLEE